MSKTTELKRRMNLFLHVDGVEILTFAEYLVISARSKSINHHDFKAHFAGSLFELLDEQATAVPNVTFGISTKGELFVEVLGKQYLPPDSFYKLASLNSAKLAHEVRDLELEVNELQGKLDQIERFFSGNTE